MVQKRPYTIPVRLSQGGKDWVDKIAQTSSRPQAEVIRTALVVASKHEKEVTGLLLQEEF